MDFITTNVLPSYKNVKTGLFSFLYVTLFTFSSAFANNSVFAVDDEEMMYNETCAQLTPIELRATDFGFPNGVGHFLVYCLSFFYFLWFSHCFDIVCSRARHTRHQRAS